MIHPGDRLLVAFGERPERTGQVILCAVDGAFVAHRLVAHRLVAVGADAPVVRLIAKGDAEACPTDRSPPTTSSASSGRSGGATDGSSPPGSTTRPGAIVARVSWWGGGAARLGRRLLATPRLGPGDRRVQPAHPVPGPDPGDHGTHALARPGDSCGREVTGMEYESPEIIASYVEDELVEEAAVCTRYCDFDCAN